MNAAPPVADSEILGLDHVFFELLYIPEFLLEETLIWLSPSRAEPTAAYLELTGDAARNWKSYYSKKGWSFVHEEPRPAVGPFQPHRGKIHLTVLEPGRIFSPKPTLRLGKEGPAIPILSLEKRRPINEWKPNFIRALDFIRKYEWQHTLPRSIQHAVWEIEECGEIAGSLSWRNAEIVLQDNDCKELRQTLVDVFFNRPEDFPLGSEVYLRILGRSGAEGFGNLVELAEHPISRKRKVVANTFGELRNPEGLPPLLKLLDDEDPEVRRSALRAIGKVGLQASSDAAGLVAEYLRTGELSEKVWAAQALIRGGDKSHEKFLLTLVKEEPRLLTDMGELGEVLADLNLDESVPLLLNRLKSDKAEFRADAAEALGKVTGLNLEYQSIDNDEQRRSTLKAYQRWWDERKKERRLEGER